MPFCCSLAFSLLEIIKLERITKKMATQKKTGREEVTGNEGVLELMSNLR